MPIIFLVISIDLFLELKLIYFEIISVKPPLSTIKRICPKPNEINIKQDDMMFVEFLKTNTKIGAKKANVHGPIPVPKKIPIKKLTR